MNRVRAVAGAGWQRYRSWPLWAQIVIGLVLVLFVIAAFSPPPKDKKIAAGQAPTTTLRVTTTTDPPPTIAVATTVVVTSTTRPPATTPTSATTVAVAAPPTSPPAPPPAGPFPPKSLADLHALGSASSIQARNVERATVGLPSCPQLRVQVVLPSGLSDRDLTAALSRVFVDENFNTRCGGIIFAYQDKSGYDDLYTVGRLMVEGRDGLSAGSNTSDIQIDGGSAISTHLNAKFNY